MYVRMCLTNYNCQCIYRFLVLITSIQSLIEENSYFLKRLYTDPDTVLHVLFTGSAGIIYSLDIASRPPTKCVVTKYGFSWINCVDKASQLEN